MTDKELLYIEDALGHEKFFETKCREASEQLSDSSLKELACQLSQRHGKLYGELYGLLGR
ncbi:MAG: hypothetical protein K6B74_00680 [Ruminococcus sp.]|nr:hypothetical protein [Ruminococcus sp.]